MSDSPKLYDQVRILTDRFRGDGAPVGSLGYIIEIYPDGAVQVEISAPATGVTRALVVAKADEIASVVVS